MRKIKDAEKRADEALRSIDNISPAEANDFIFSKIQNRLDPRNTSFEYTRLKPMYRLAALLIFFIVANIISFNYFQSNKTTSVKQKTGVIGAFAHDYNLDQNSNNY